jgi:CRISPR-associated protein Cas2
MVCIVAYDVSDTRVRNRVARYLLKYGVRLQKSVFAIEVERHAFEKITVGLRRIAGEQADIAIFRLCADCCRKAIRSGDNAPSFYIL